MSFRFTKRERTMTMQEIQNAQIRAQWALDRHAAADSCDYDHVYGYGAWHARYAELQHAKRRLACQLYCTQVEYFCASRCCAPGQHPV